MRPPYNVVAPLLDDSGPEPTVKWRMCEVENEGSTLRGRVHTQETFRARLAGTRNIQGEASVQLRLRESRKKNQTRNVRKIENHEGHRLVRVDAGRRRPKLTFALTRRPKLPRLHQTDRESELLLSPALRPHTRSRPPSLSPGSPILLLPLPGPAGGGFGVDRLTCDQQV